ncbi:hypothetical protein DACRYDRAFT_119632 [Dacryopinax primogenitus]|uniref:DUF1687-domain-containing protein n=1 Tax=Dacryopinax primogenitus (strain DJM 731) TaxID=1858805 RepID=M5FQV3_DACPD|nr:uncharacterized protein DACRYDRAFT_119632 [Dacryopinax primogenitus]EJT97164.1 hypothetical protein DACRYDRAFT_119632 [Dacryopinax primogenitus]
MAFAFFRRRPNISIFHSPSVPASNEALQLLQKAVSEPYPPGKLPLDFDLEVIDSQPPTPDQISTIQNYLGSNASFGASPSFSADTNSPAAIHKAAIDSLDSVKWPIVVNWDDGQASIGSVQGVKDMLKTLSDKRGGGSKNGSS